MNDYMMNAFKKQIDFAMHCGKDLSKTNFYFFYEREGVRKMTRVNGIEQFKTIAGVYSESSSNDMYPVFRDM